MTLRYRINIITKEVEVRRLVAWENGHEYVWGSPTEEEREEVLRMEGDKKALREEGWPDPDGLHPIACGEKCDGCFGEVATCGESETFCDFSLVSGILGERGDVLKALRSGGMDGLRELVSGWMR